MTDSHEGHAMTGRDPTVLRELIADNGRCIWDGGTPEGDRGDRNYRPEFVERHDRRNRRTNRKDI